MLGMLSAPNLAEVGFRALNLIRGTPTWGTFLAEHVAQGLFLERPLGSKVAPKSELLTTPLGPLINRNVFSQKYLL